MGYGDEILAAGQARRYFLEHEAPVIITDKHDRPRWHPIWEGNPAIVRPTDIASARAAPTRAYYRLCSAPNARPYIVYPFTAETGWTFNQEFRARDHVARIYLTAHEASLGLNLRQTGPGYVLVEPYSKHENLRWPRAHWQALISALRPYYRIVQHTHTATDYALDDVEHVSTHSFRDACGVLASASLYIRGESGMCHAAAALGVPQVTIWGGCMDWDVLGNYPRQMGVGVEMPPCGSYLACAHCEAVMQAISPLVVAAAAQSQLDTYGIR